MSTDEIRTNRFVPEDENGNMRATLAVLKDGPALRLYARTAGRFGRPRKGAGDVE